MKQQCGCGMFLQSEYNLYIVNPECTIYLMMFLGEVGN